jgi:hypothetical protein
MPMPEGRHLCFGRYEADDLLCIQCPPYLLNRCLRMTPGAMEPRTIHDAQLLALKAQLRGE